MSASKQHPAPAQPILHVPGASLEQSGGQTAGMVRQNAIVDRCDGICALSMRAPPHSASTIHHHGPQDTVVYAVSGTGGCVVSEGGKKRVVLKPGDFCLIPAYMEHQEVNDGDDESVLTIVRSGRTPAVVNLTGWDGEEVKE